MTNRSGQPWGYNARGGTKNLVEDRDWASRGNLAIIEMQMVWSEANVKCRHGFPIDALQPGVPKPVDAIPNSQALG